MSAVTLSRATPAASVPRKASTHGARRSWLPWSVRLCTIAALLIAWELGARQASPIMAAPPSKVLTTLVEMIRDGSMVEALVATNKPFALGYLLAVVVGVPLGLLAGRFRLVDASIGWLIVAGYAIPTIALVPVFMLWFGLGFLIKVMMVFSMTVFVIAINTRDGVQNVPRSLVEVGLAFNASASRTLWQVIFPSVIPSIMTGLRIGVGKAVIGVIIAEFFTALGGVGGIIVTAGASFQPDRMFAAVIVLCLGAVALTWAVGLLERVIAPWHAQTKAGGM